MAGFTPSMIGGRYELLSKLGAGGMAEVWLAADHRLNDKHVAIKRLHGFRVGGEESAVDLERARREAFAVSRLSHPNLVAVTDFIAENGEPFIVMEYVAGTTLDELTSPDGLTAARAARIGAQLAAALAEAHALNIVHRDIKPANIMVTPRGDAKLADFGIARSTEDPRFTKTGMFTGTMRYLAPEILDGSDATPASDVWALGATLFEAIEGRPAFDAPTTVGLIAAIAMGPLPVQTKAPELAPIVTRMLSRDPQERPTADEVAGDLLAAAAVTERRDAGAASVSESRRRLDPHPPLVPVAGRSGAEANIAPSDSTVVVQRPRDPSRRPATRPKRRSPRWMLVAVPIVIAVAGIPIALSLQGGTDHPLAGSGNRPPLGHTAPGSPSPSTAGSSYQVIVGGGAPDTVVFKGVTVTGGTDFTSRPGVRSRATTRPSSLEVDELILGRGAAAMPTSRVTIRLIGLTYRTGRPFESTWALGRALSVPLSSLVPGLAQGIGGRGRVKPMQVGGRRILVVPSTLGYGSRATAKVPANSALVYVVDLVRVG